MILNHNDFGIASSKKFCFNSGAIIHGKTSIQKEEDTYAPTSPCWRKIGYYLKVSGNWWDLWLADVSPTIAKIVLEGCQAVYQALMPIYMSVPTKEDDWLQICNGTFKK